MKCTRCGINKEASEFVNNSSRCNDCRKEANALNVAHYRQRKLERKENERFREAMSAWIIPGTNIHGHGTG